MRNEWADGISEIRKPSRLDPERLLEHVFSVNKLLDPDRLDGFLLTTTRISDRRAGHIFGVSLGKYILKNADNQTSKDHMII
jgi:hypothetical protein